jgi:pilus assembly protein CpaF
LNLPIASVRQQIASAVNVILHVQRLRDGSRKIVSIAEVTGMEGEVITLHELITYQSSGLDPVNGKVLGKFKASKLQPRFFDKICEYGFEQKYIELMEKI